jgi:hypothetical protein
LTLLTQDGECACHRICTQLRAGLLFDHSFCPHFVWTGREPTILLLREKTLSTRGFRNRRMSQTLSQISPLRF